MTITWQLVGSSLILTIDGITPQEVKDMATGLQSLGDHAHGTFYAETESQIIGITDDADGCTATRDGELPGAVLSLYHCK